MILLGFKIILHKKCRSGKIQRVQQKIPGCWTYVQQNENKFQKVCIHTSKMLYKLVLINVFNVLLVEKYQDKKITKNQQHYTFKLVCIRLFEICFHFAGHRSSTQEFSAGPSEFLPELPVIF